VIFWFCEIVRFTVPFPPRFGRALEFAMFRVAREIEFCYGHRLLNYDGKCKYLHGHNGKAVIILENESLDERGMLVDFSDIKKQVATWIDLNLDHRMILSKADPFAEYFQQQGQPVFLIDANPTAENIAKLIFDFAKSQKLPVLEVTLWETFKSYASYRELPEST
jgi:6-pyruvoyltetrahydropterin/6-carboxytetrahydropterin synthase